jgi:hypothetical protein
MYAAANPILMEFSAMWQSLYIPIYARLCAKKPIAEWLNGLTLAPDPAEKGQIARGG